MVVALCRQHAGQCCRLCHCVSGSSMRFDATACARRISRIPRANFHLLTYTLHAHAQVWDYSIANIIACRRHPNAPAQRHVPPGYVPPADAPPQIERPSPRELNADLRGLRRDRAVFLGDLDLEERARCVGPALRALLQPINSVWDPVQLVALASSAPLIVNLHKRCLQPSALQPLEATRISQVSVMLCMAMLYVACVRMHMASASHRQTTSASVTAAYAPLRAHTHARTSYVALCARDLHAICRSSPLVARSFLSAPIHLTRRPTKAW